MDASLRAILPPMPVAEHTSVEAMLGEGFAAEEPLSILGQACLSFFALYCALLWCWLRSSIRQAGEREDSRRRKSLHPVPTPTMGPSQLERIPSSGSAQREKTMLQNPRVVALGGRPVRSSSLLLRCPSSSSGESTESTDESSPFGGSSYPQPVEIPASNPSRSRSLNDTTEDRAWIYFAKVKSAPEPIPGVSRSSRARQLGLTAQEMRMLERKATTYSRRTGSPSPARTGTPAGSPRRAPC
ncbi:hypothetical protein T484DRAFT_1985927 [Baffinella frigidus]|nr:hypothetical protein T484DRAFT_1985927 [Cryptophyta sp. CCMP2293]